VIELADVHKSYGATKVVRGLTLRIAPGELVSLLGPSGCGKTTTLRMIAGLERPESGRIAIDGRDVCADRVFVPPEKRALGMVFQSYAVWPHRNVEANVAYPLVLQKVPAAEREARVVEALRWVRLDHLRQRMPHALSGGQLQRVALARALVSRPRVLLLDEPLSNLDAALREELRAEIAALRARLGTTMVFVTHDQSEALALSDRVAVMNRGVIEQIATPEALYTEPATPFVAGFVGGSNLLEGEARDGRFHTAHGAFALPAAIAGATGPGTLAVRPADLRVGDGDVPLTLSARLFLGHAVEYRFPFGDGLLRAVGPPCDAKAGDRIGVRVDGATFFPKR
jgi:ABC-type Fe3+/spermidine/putrescine transport system ATPase subunit